MIISAKAFQNAVNHALVAVPNRPHIPVMAGVKIEAADGFMTVSGYDGTTQATEIMPADGDLPETLINGALLKNVISKSKAETMTLELEDRFLRVDAGRAKVRLQTMPTDEYPKPLVTPDGGFTIDGTGWSALTRSVVHAASKEEAIPGLTAVNMVLSHGVLTAQATDRYRLAENAVMILGDGNRAEENAAGVTGDHDGSFMVSAKTVIDIDRHLDSSTTWEIRFDDSLVAVNDGRSQIVRSLISDRFPPLSKLFPDSTPFEVTADREDLADAVSRSTALLDRNEPVLLTVDPDGITVEAGTGDKGAMTEQVDASGHTDDGPVTLRFNPAYIADALAAVNSDEVTLGWEDAVRPVSVSGDDLSHRQLVMPIRK